MDDDEKPGELERQIGPRLIKAMEDADVDAILLAELTGIEQERIEPRCGGT
jgi:hypothetical protein